MTRTTDATAETIIDLREEVPRLEDGWQPDTPADDTLLRQFFHNQADMNQAVALALGGRSKEVRGAHLADAGSPIPYLNQALVARAATTAHDPVFDEVEAFFDASGSPATLLSVWPTPDLTARGWVLYGHPVLVVRAPSDDPQPLPPGVDIAVVSDAEGLATVERIMIEGYPLPVPEGTAPGAILPAPILDTGLVVRIGYLDGKPVATGSAFLGHGLVNLVDAATLPAARRRGVWQSIVQARVADAPHWPAVAFTSDLSRPGFLRMGFLPITRLTLWGRG